MIVRVLAAVLALATIAPAVAAAAPAPQPPLDLSQLTYQPFGRYGPNGIATIPTPDQPPMPTSGKKFNPSGNYIAYDNNVFSTLALPYRAAADTTTNDPYGNGGDPRPGFCAQAPADDERPGELAQAAGKCPNHQLEWGEYFAETMQDILGDFGVTIRRYEFESPGSGNTQPGRAIGVAAVVPGADDPDESILVSGHYDQTNDAPASGWDSAEGNAETIRAAKLMADYWRRTGTRPSATVKFLPWDAEEAGLLGAFDYVDNVVPPGQADKVRGYYNTDPCAGGYPAQRRGNPLDRIPLRVQLANTALADDTVNLGNGAGPPPGSKERIEAYNAKVKPRLEQLLDRLDDKLTLAPGLTKDIFVSSAEASAASPSDIDARDGVQISTEREILFTSDWVAFEEIGVPFLNPAPDIAGPGTQGSQNQIEALQTFHTPMDNLQTVNRLTSADATGTSVSEGWAKGMEFCSQMVASFMLQPDQGGAQTASPGVVAYYEALPNEAVADQPVGFDADGSYQYSNLMTRTKVPADQLEFSWDFGDGTTGTGEQVDHAYPAVGIYQSKLTVRNRVTGATDTMTVPITVTPATTVGPILKAPAPEDADGSFELEWEPTAPAAKSYEVFESRDLQEVLADDAEAGQAPRWVADEPTDPALEPWQPSDSATAKTRGNLRTSGTRSFWAGVAQEDQARSPVNAQSTMRTAQPIDLPKGSGELVYQSTFRNEGDDRGFVEVGLTDATGKVPEVWTPVDEVGGRPQDAYSVSDPASTTDTAFETRRVDLSRFDGSRVYLRFRYAVGDADRATSTPTGWYVDDLRLRSGTFTKVADAEGTKTTLSGRAAGPYGYRIRAVFADGVRTRAGNIESLRVTTGATPTTPAQPQGPGGPAATTPAATTSTTTAPARPPVRVTTGPATRTPRVALTRRVLRGGRLRLACRVTGATLRTCVVRVQARRGGKLRTVKVLTLRAGRSTTLKLRRTDKRLVLRATATTTTGRKLSVRRTLTRR